MPDFTADDGYAGALRYTRRLTVVINWQETATAFVATVGGGGVCLFAAAWLIKAVITDRLKANTNAEIERLKISLKTEADLTIERLRNELQTERLRFSKLHEKRAEIIAEIYKRSVEVEKEGKLFITRMGRGPTLEKGDTKAMTMLREFNVFVDQRRIYLPDRICNMLVKFSELVVEPVAHATVYGDIDQPNPRTVLEMQAGFTKAFGIFAEEIPNARRELEQEFRKILGAM